MKNDFSKALKVLGLDGQATRPEIEQAYLEQVKRWHPDRFMNDERRRREAEQRLKGVNNAYMCLKDFQPTQEEMASPPPKAEPEKAKPSQGGSFKKNVVPARQSYADCSWKKLKKEIERETPWTEEHWIAQVLWWRVLGVSVSVVLLAATALITWKWVVPQLLAMPSYSMKDWIALLEAVGTVLGGAAMFACFCWLAADADPVTPANRPQRRKRKSSKGRDISAVPQCKKADLRSWGEEPREIQVGTSPSSARVTSGKPSARRLR